MLAGNARQPRVAARRGARRRRRRRRRAAPRHARGHSGSGSGGAECGAEAEGQISAASTDPPGREAPHVRGGLRPAARCDGRRLGATPRGRGRRRRRPCRPRRCRRRCRRRTRTRRTRRHLFPRHFRRGGLRRGGLGRHHDVDVGGDRRPPAPGLGVVDGAQRRGRGVVAGSAQQECLARLPRPAAVPAGDRLAQGLLLAARQQLLVRRRRAERGQAAPLHVPQAASARRARRAAHRRARKPPVAPGRSPARRPAQLGRVPLEGHCGGHLQDARFLREHTRPRARQPLRVRPCPPPLPSLPLPSLPL